MITSSTELSGPEKTNSRNTVPRHVKLAFHNPVRCRIIWLTMHLQKVGSRSVNFRKDFNMVSLDEKAQLARCSSFGGVTKTQPCLHAKRIVVFGRPVSNDLDLPQPNGSNQINIKSWLDKPPRLNRFKVHSDSYKRFPFIQ
ncbi:probable phosphoinositide phosphatase SAC9 [Impatiens glandulifera]|uniref:probable phosphoinositide phosphatase SAC9 n=1 Tax=Impatiens glandulifera TaxID=253017 RepID=UPI001FB10D65|nr:probable phosphoinositide phosphatase SAC9 [Impatiens glandulifera]